MIYDRATRMGRGKESQCLVTDRESVSFPSQLLACLSLELSADQTRQMLGMYCLAERDCERDHDRNKESGVRSSSPSVSPFNP